MQSKMRKYNKLLSLTALLVLLATAAVQAQEEESNLEKFTPAVLFGKGTWELNSFYNLYTQNQGRNSDGESFDFGERQTFLNIMYQFTLGVSDNARLNVGLDVWVNKSLYDGDRTGNPFKVLLFDEENFSRTVVSAIGPRVRFVPFESLSNFSVQSSFLFPVAQDQETPRFTSHDRYTSFTQFFYDHKINNEFRLFLEADLLYRIKRNSEQVNFLRTPVSAFLSYFPSSRVTLFGFAQYSPRFERVSNEVDETYGLSEDFFQLGGGLKYQWSRRLGIELSYGNFIASKGINGAGAGYSLNLGFRYIRAK